MWNKLVYMGYVCWVLKNKNIEIYRLVDFVSFKYLNKVVCLEIDWGLVTYIYILCVLASW